MMSLNPTWFSTIFGVYYFAGSFVCRAVGPRDRHLAGEPEGPVRRRHERRAHAQHRQADARVHLLLDLHRVLAAPADLDRGPARGDPVLHHALQAGLVVDGHRSSSSATSSSRSARCCRARSSATRSGSPSSRSGSCCMHYIDIYWLVMPTLYPDGVTFHWTQPLAFLGVGLVAVAFGDLAPARPPAGADARSLPGRIAAVQAAMSGHDTNATRSARSRTRSPRTRSPTAR